MFFSRVQKDMRNMVGADRADHDGVEHGRQEQQRQSERGVAQRHLLFKKQHSAPVNQGSSLPPGLHSFEPACGKLESLLSFPAQERAPVRSHDESFQLA